MYKVTAHYSGYPLVSFWYAKLEHAELRIADLLSCGAQSATLERD